MATVSTTNQSLLREGIGMTTTVCLLTRAVTKTLSEKHGQIKKTKLEILSRFRKRLCGVNRHKAIELILMFVEH